jgi:hypothetical protein
MRIFRFLRDMILLKADSAEHTQQNYHAFRKWFFIISAVCFALALVQMTSGASVGVFFWQTNNPPFIFLAWLVKAFLFTYIPVCLSRLERHYIGFGAMREANPVTVERSFDAHERINAVIDHYENSMDKGELDKDAQLKLGMITRENLQRLRMDLSDLPIFKVSYKAIDLCLEEIAENEQKLNAPGDLAKMAFDAEIRQAVEESKQAVLTQKKQNNK